MIQNIYLGLGSNLGHRGENLKKAMCALGDILQIENVSSVIRSAAWGYTDQPRFLNMALKVSTDMDALSLLHAVKTIEQDMGRIKTQKWGPRLIDIDILFYGESIIHSEALTIPHPYIQERDFVLRPLLDLCPDFIHPLLRRSIKRLYADFLDSLSLK